VKYFPPFRFDTRRGALTRAGRPVPLTRKAADVLSCLIGHDGDVVSHAEILARVWPDTHVHPGNIKVLVRELRLALDDDPRRPRYIRAESGRGYAFVAQAADALSPLLSGADAAHATSRIGRDAEFAIMTEPLDIAIERSTPQLILLTGGRGLGKTHLCRSLAEHACARGTVRVASAQALEAATSGGGDLALPLEALESLERQYQTAVPALLARCAPAGRGALLRSSDAASLLRDLTTAFEKIAADAPLLVILEDLQWADVRSLECLRAIGLRAAAGRLCVLATLAPTSDAHLASLHAIAAAWPADRRTVVSIDPWAPTELNTLLGQRLGTDLAGLVRARMQEVGGGNPGLATSAVESLVRGHRAPIDPELWLERGLREAVRDLAERMPSADREVLDIAARLGPAFTASDIAAFLPVASAVDPSSIEVRLDGLAASHLFVERAPWHRSDADAVFRWRAPIVADALLPRTVAALTRVPATSRGR